MLHRTPTDPQRAAFSISTCLADTYLFSCCQQGQLLLLRVDRCLQSSPEQTTVYHECCCSSDLLCQKIRARHSAAARSSLAAFIRCDHARRSVVQPSATVPSQWLLQGPGTICLRQTGRDVLIDVLSRTEDIPFPL